MPTADSPDQRMPHTSRRKFISQLSWLGGCAVLSSTAAGFAAGQISAAEVDSSASDHWNQWRGPQRTGFATRSSTPDSLDESHLQTLWNVPFEPSYSGPLISGNAIYTTATVGKKTEHVYRLDRTTGKNLGTIVGRCHLRPLLCQSQWRLDSRHTRSGWLSSVCPGDSRSAGLPECRKWRDSLEARFRVEVQCNTPHLRLCGFTSGDGKKWSSCRREELSVLSIQKRETSSGDHLKMAAE